MNKQPLTDDAAAIPKPPKPTRKAPRLEQTTLTVVKLRVGKGRYMGMEMRSGSSIIDLAFNGPGADYEDFGTLRLGQVKELITLLQEWVATQ